MAKDYQTYNIFDFITDERFKSWVLESTDELDYFWQSWIDSHPEKAEDVAKAREFLLSIKFQKQEDMLEKKAAIYAKVMEKSKKAAFKASSDRSSSSSKSFTILKVAASIVILLSLSLLLLNQSGEKEPQPQETTAIAYKTKMTRRGEKLTLMLPDGSMVKLNSESSLKYPTSFDTQREVHLQGEAYFEVERDTLNPFVVRTGEVSTEVLGTSFNINYSPGDSMVQVAVTSGKVAVTSQHVNERFYLLPREVLTCKTSKFTKRYFDEEDLLLGWKDGILAFENAGIDEITRRLSAWYDVDFEIRGSAKMKRKFSGKFKNRTLRDVLEGISYSSNFEFSIHKDKVIIKLK
jgi:transmembrane sensor